MKQFVLPSVYCYCNLVLNKTLTLADGTTINLNIWPARGEEKGIIFCVQGLGGHCGYYDVLEAYFCTRGFTIIGPDLRGHGLSSGIRGDIPSFKLYINDLNEVFATLSSQFKIQDSPPEADPPSAEKLKIIVLGESMGCPLAIHWLARYQPSIDGLILAAPVLMPTVGPTLKEVLTYILWGVINRKKPVLNLQGREDLGSRVPAFHQRLLNDKLFIKKASVRFITKLSLTILTARSLAGKIKVPMLMIFGEQDKVTDHKVSRKYFDRMPGKNKILVCVPESYHAIFNDPQAGLTFETIYSWLESIQRTNPHTS